MSLLHSVIVPKLTQGLINIALDPKVEQFMLDQLKMLGGNVMTWIEKKQSISKSAQTQIPHTKE